MENTKPLPTYITNLRTVLDSYVVDDGVVIGRIDDEFPFFHDIDDLDELYKDFSKILQLGFKLEGFEEYKFNPKFGFPTQPVDIKGYPPGTTESDIYLRVYYKGICVGKVAWDLLGLLSKTDAEFLDEHGIEHSFQWGIAEEYKAKPESELILPQPEICVTEYDKEKGYYHAPDRDGILRQVKDDLYLVGILRDGQIVAPSPDEQNYYRELGIIID